MSEASVWCLDLTRIGLEPMRALLSADEQLRADSYRQPGDVDRFVKGRGALRMILGAYAGVDPHELTFVEGKGRKPELAGHPALQFNLSHSGARVLIAVSDDPVGVDIEAVRPLEWRELARTVFHPDEIAALKRRPHPAQDFFQLWAHKEAWLKATGIGLTDHLTSIHVALDGGAVTAPPALSPHQWFAHMLRVTPGYRASIVSRHPALVVRDRTEEFRP